MIRLLIFIISIILLYLGFSIISKYDVPTHIILGNYDIVTNAFFFGTIILVAYIVLFTIIKFITLIYKIPCFIAGRIKTSKSEQSIKDLIDAYSCSLSGEKSKAHRIATKLKSILPQDLAMHSHIILSATDNDMEQRAYHMRYLLEMDVHSLFNAKTLAKYFLKHQYYKQGLEYINKALDIQPKDPESLEIVVDLYGHLMMWDKFRDSLSTLEKYTPQFSEALRNKLAHHYFSAAKDALANGMDDKAVEYIESALIHKVDFIEAVNLLCELNTASGHSNRNVHILESAFAASPSFELFQLYTYSVNLGDIEIYDNLANLADPIKHLGLFIAISSCLDLQENLNMLRDKMKQEE